MKYDIPDAGLAYEQTAENETKRLEEERDELSEKMHEARYFGEFYIETKPIRPENAEFLRLKGYKVANNSIDNYCRISWEK